MGVRLVIEDFEGQTQVVPLDEAPVSIGRSEGSTVRLDEKNVSRKHARLTLQDNGWRLEDLDSYNGVRVNGSPLRGTSALRTGDTVQIGDFQIVLREEDDVRPASGAASANGAEAEAGVALATSSADLPKLSPEELEALRNGDDSVLRKSAEPQPERDSDGDFGGDDEQDDGLAAAPASGGGRAWIGVVLGLVVVGGGGWFAMNSSSDAGQGQEMAARADTATGSSAKEDAPKAASAAPDAAPDSEPAPAAPKEEAAAPAQAAPEPPVEPAPADAQAGPDSGMAAPEPVADAAPEPAPAAEPAQPEPAKPEPAKSEPAKPEPAKSEPAKSTAKKKKTSSPPADPQQLLADARKAMLGGNASKAYSLAKKSYSAGKSADALQLMGVSACKMKDAKKAKYVAGKMSSAKKSALKSVCSQNGVEL